MATQYPDTIGDAIEGAAFEFGGLVANELNIFLNREDLNVSREMQDSIEHITRRQGGELEVVVGPTAEHAQYVHEGTEPHFPPPDSLIDWVEFRAFAPDAGSPEDRALLLAIHISREGTEPNPFLDRFHQQKGRQHADAFAETLNRRINIAQSNR